MKIPHLVILFLSLVSVALPEAPNADLVKMVQAKLPAKTTILAIEAAQPGFDTSADALIALSAAKVPAAIVDALIARSAATTTPTGHGGNTDNGNIQNPEVVIMRDGEATHSMQYLRPNTRTAARVFGYGGVATYAALAGTRAALRSTSRAPAFSVSIPSNAQPASYVTLIHMAVRRNGTREIMVSGGAGFSYSTGFPGDRVIALATEKLADQSSEHAGFTVYTVAPSKQLVDGEYAMVLASSRVQVFGFFLDPGPVGSFFDFGVGH